MPERVEKLRVFFASGYLMGGVGDGSLWFGPPRLHSYHGSVAHFEKASIIINML